MNRTLQCQSLSELPPVSSFEKTEKVFITVPVMILAFQKLNSGVLLVTDFSDIPELGFAHNVLPQSLPDQFIFKDGPLSPFKVLALGVPHFRVDSVWSMIQLYGPHLKHYDYGRDDRSNLLSAGVIATVNIKINEYKGYLEGFLCSINVLTRKRLSEADCLGKVTDQQFRLFMGRVGEHLNLTLYDRIIQSFPAEKFISRLSLLEASFKTVQPEPMNTNSSKIHKAEIRTAEKPKIRKLNPSEAVYKQQVTQPAATQSAFIDDQPSQHECNFFSQDTSQSESQTQPDSNLPTLWLQNRVNTVTFQQFCAVKCYEVAPGTSFRFMCRIKSMDPLPEDVFVKSFRGTLKIAQMNFTLTGGDKKCTMEINTSDEGCNFFNLDEEEEAINHIAEFHKSLQTIMTKEMALEVKAKKMVLPLGHTLMYWCPSSKISDLISS